MSIFCPRDLDEFLPFSLQNGPNKYDLMLESEEISKSAEFVNLISKYDKYSLKEKKNFTMLDFWTPCFFFDEIESGFVDIR